MTEQNLVESANATRTEIKISLLKRGMKQRDLAELIHEKPQQVSRAIRGDMQPRSVDIRKKIYQVLNIK